MDEEYLDGLVISILVIMMALIIIYTALNYPATGVS